MRRPGVDFARIEIENGPEFIQINPATGNRQLILSANDVMSVIEHLGGASKAAQRLMVEPIEIEHWIDDHYVPTRYAKAIQKLTGWSIWSIQQPPLPSP